MRENGKFALVLGNFEIGRIRNRRRKIAKSSPIPTVLISVRPRSTTAKRRRCPEPSSASIPAPTAASRGDTAARSVVATVLGDPDRPSANGPRPISFASQAQPKSIRPNTPSPAQLLS
ncbi:hypothetical protein CDL15_Pgr017641 [Punica granatum]|uniref:Uncharacterized protein n=1 Tax=Punica granatum TaxID=22663 RepID=A0A218XQW1_PUNGR|nr:hypothetical protein CDL15_Pgr017641 [Punica granatum]